MACQLIALFTVMASLMTSMHFLALAKPADSASPKIEARKNISKQLPGIGVGIPGVGIPGVGIGTPGVGAPGYGIPDFDVSANIGTSHITRSFVSGFGDCGVSLGNMFLLTLVIVG